MAFRLFVLAKRHALHLLMLLPPMPKPTKWQACGNHAAAKGAHECVRSPLRTSCCCTENTRNLIGWLRDCPLVSQALVSGVPKGALVMLDLYAEVFPLWKAIEGFYGADFIFCMLHNFGGNLEMYGALPAVAAAPAEPMQKRDMIGVGMCPEGIEQNPVVYDLMAEWAFRQALVPQGQHSLPFSLCCCIWTVLKIDLMKHTQILWFLQADFMASPMSSSMRLAQNVSRTCIGDVQEGSGAALAVGGGLCAAALRPRHARQRAARLAAAAGLRVQRHRLPHRPQPRHSHQPTRSVAAPKLHCAVHPVTGPSALRAAALWAGTGRLCSCNDAMAGL